MTFFSVGFHETSVSGECVTSLVLSHHSQNLKRQTSVTASVNSVIALRQTSVIQPRVTAQFHLESKGKYILKALGQADPKDAKRKEAPRSILAPLFICFFLLPLSLPYVHWASKEGCLFCLRSSLWSSDLPLFYFHGLSPSLSFSHRHFGLPFPILTT